MSELFVQHITMIGESEHILNILNIPIPKTIVDFGVENTLWTLTHLHFKASMRGSHPISLHKLSKSNPNITLAVTSGSTTGPNYRFLLNKGAHIPIEMSYQNNLTPHYQWAEALSPANVKAYVKNRTPANLEKISNIIKLTIEDPDIEITEEEIDDPMFQV